MKKCTVSGCTNEHHARGYCAKHLYRIKKYGSPSKTSFSHDPKENIELQSKVMPNGCWEWQGSISPNGYGGASYKNKRISAHRLSYLVFHEESPEGRFVLHRCDNRSCVNPDHLFLGSHQDNMDDMKNKNRQLKGERNKKARLSSEDVLFICKKLNSGTTQQELAKKFGTNKTTINAIATGRNWLWLTKNVLRK